MAKLLKYRYYCSSESTNIEEWREESEGAPTQCKNDSGHTIDSSSIVIIETRADNIVKIQEESVLTGEHFSSTQVKLSCAANSWTEVDVSFPFPVSLLDAQFIVSSENKDDEIEAIALPDKIIGTITADVAVNDTEITVSQTVIDNTAVGRNLKLDDGTNSEDLGKVLSIDKTNLKITVENGAANAYTASTPTYCKADVYFVENFTLGHPGRHTVGQGKIGASPLPANEVLRLRYNNKHASNAKDFYIQIDYLY